MGGMPAIPPPPSKMGERRGGGAVLALLLVAAALPAHAADLRITIAGPAETLFASATDACEAWDVPDAPARAWRAADGSVRLVAAHHRARVFAGPSLERPGYDCAVVFSGARRDNPAAHDDFGWLAAPIPLPDGRVVALVHDEFHGHRRRTLCPRGGYMACWWNTVTATVSTDGGRRFGPPRFVAGLPYRYRGDLGRRAGIFSPSNAVTRDGWTYVFAYAEAYGAQRRGACLMRSRAPADPASWRAWDGKGFTVRFVDPYAEDIADPAAHTCAPLPGLPFTIGGVVRHAPSGRFVAVMAGRRAETPGAEPVAGIWSSSSADLIAWTPLRLVWAAPLLTHRDCAQAHAYAYPALIDRDSVTAGFDDSDGTADLYLTRMALKGCKTGTSRDLIRFPVTIAPHPHRPAP